MPDHWDKRILCIPHRIRTDMRRSVINFLNVQLRSSGSPSIEAEYPSLFGEFPGGESLVIKLNGHVASHVGFIVRDFQHPHFRMKVGLIGSVATATEFRRRGFATQLLNQAVIELRRRGCAIAVLWGEKTDFYAGMGFFKSGREMDLGFSPQDVPDFPEKPILFESRKHAHLMWRWYQKHEGKLDRSLEEQKRLCETPNTRIFITERNQSVTSYLAIGKGADFKNFIHEWGGDLADLAKNISGVQRLYFTKEKLTLIAPGYYDLSPLKRIASWESAGVLGMIKVIDRHLLLNTYCQYLRTRNITFAWDKEKQELHWEDRTLPLKEEEQLLKVVFGESAASTHPTVPFFLWGFDSI